MLKSHTHNHHRVNPVVGQTSYPLYTTPVSNLMLKSQRLTTSMTAALWLGQTPHPLYVICSSNVMLKSHRHNHHLVILSPKHYSQFTPNAKSCRLATTITVTHFTPIYYSQFDWHECHTGTTRPPVVPVWHSCHECYTGTTRPPTSWQPCDKGDQLYPHTLLAVRLWHECHTGTTKPPPSWQPCDKGDQLYPHTLLAVQLWHECYTGTTRPPTSWQPCDKGDQLYHLYTTRSLNLMKSHIQPPSTWQPSDEGNHVSCALLTA